MRYRESPLSTEFRAISAQIYELVNRWLQPGSDENDRFVAQLGLSPPLKSLMQVPLLATLVILVFRQTRRLPGSEVRLYEIFMDLHSEGWDLAKGLLKVSKFGSTIKTGVLKSLAVKLHEGKLRHFEKIDLDGAAIDCVRLNEESTRDLVNEILRDGLISSSGERYEFSHFSFQEYLVAKYYNGDPSHKGIQNALQEFLRGDDWWYQVLRFFVGLSGSPKELAQWLRVEQDRLEALQDAPVTGAHRRNAIYDRAQIIFSFIRDMYPNFKGGF